MSPRLLASILLLLPTLACGSSAPESPAAAEPIVVDPAELAVVDPAELAVVDPAELAVVDHVACSIRDPHGEHLVVRFSSAGFLGYSPPARGTLIVFLSSTIQKRFSNVDELGPYLAAYRQANPGATRLYVTRTNEDRAGAATAARLAADAGFSQVQRCDPWLNQLPLHGLAVATFETHELFPGTELRLGLGNTGGFGYRLGYGNESPMTRTASSSCARVSAASVTFRSLSSSFMA